MPEMKAIVINEYGGPDVLRLVDTPRPAPESGQILIRIHAAGVNPVDWKVRRGDMQAFQPLSFPHILGNDVAGIVDTVGANVTDFQAGDAVFALIRGGGYAEYAVMNTSDAALKPQTLDFIHAAALPVAALTAWQALFTHGGLTAGQRVLIHAGAGGVGHLAIQFAKNRGAFVYATASAANQDFLRELGADRPIDYSVERFEEIARDVDVVFDTIGGDTQARSWGTLKPDGVLVCIVGPAEEAGQAHGRRGVFFSAQVSQQDLTQIAALIDDGKVKVDVGVVLPLAEARRAQELSESHHTRGKIVLATV